MARRARAPPAAQIFRSDRKIHELLRRIDGRDDTRKGRELDALEIIAEQLEKLRMLKEYELGVRIKDVGGTLDVKPVEK